MCPYVPLLSFYLFVPAQLSNSPNLAQTANINHSTGLSRCKGFVLFDTQTEALRALKMNGVSLEGARQPLIIKFADNHSKRTGQVTITNSMQSAQTPRLLMPMARFGLGPGGPPSPGMLAIQTLRPLIVPGQPQPKPPGGMGGLMGGPVGSMGGPMGGLQTVQPPQWQWQQQTQQQPQHQVCTEPVCVLFPFIQILALTSF